MRISFVELMLASTDYNDMSQLQVYPSKGISSDLDMGVKIVTFGRYRCYCRVCVFFQSCVALSPTYLIINRNRFTWTVPAQLSQMETVDILSQTFFGTKPIRIVSRIDSTIDALGALLGNRDMLSYVVGPPKSRALVGSQWCGKISTDL